MKPDGKFYANVSLSRLGKGQTEVIKIIVARVGYKREDGIYITSIKNNSLKNWL